MRLLFWLCLLFTLPLLAAIGHDIYYAYHGATGLLPARPFQFSDAGWLWLTYAPGSYHFARNNVDPHFWKKYVGPVLEHKSIVVAAVPAFICYVLFFFCRFFVPSLRASRAQMSPARRRKPSYADDDTRRQSVKYKRK